MQPKQEKKPKMKHNQHELCKEFSCLCCDLAVKLQLIMQECYARDAYDTDLVYFVFEDTDGTVYTAGPISLE